MVAEYDSDDAFRRYAFRRKVSLVRHGAHQVDGLGLRPLDLIRDEMLEELWRTGEVWRESLPRLG